MHGFEEIKYAGYTYQELRTVLRIGEESETGLDSIFGDDAVAHNIVEALLDRITELEGVGGAASA